tara:strand:- start:35505 stop:35978 length:474 start_codon:yes stop_codon:yes gene_type:complete
MKLSKNLSLKEMTKSWTALRKGIDNTPTPEHIENMKALAENIFQPIRDYFGVPIHISSGYRSKALNEAIGGSKTSQHSKGQAIDLDRDGHSQPDNSDLFIFVKDNLDFDQMIWEFGTDENPDWVHISYNPGEKQRNQILVAYKDSKNRTRYKQWKKK